MRNLFLIFFITLTSSVIFSQEKKILDSLLHVSNKVTGVSKGKVLVKIAKTYQNNNDYESAMKYYLDALEFLDSTSSSEDVLKIYSGIGYIYYVLEDATKAKPFFETYYKLSINYKDTYEICCGLIYLGLVAIEQEEPITALNNFYQAEKLSDYLKSSRLKSAVLHNIGLVYSKKHQYQDALNYYSKSYKLSKEINDDYGISLGYVNIGNLYYYFNDFDKSKLYTDSAYRIAKKQQIDYVETICLQNYAKLYDTLCMSDSALKYYKLLYLERALSAQKANNDVNSMVQQYIEKSKGREIQFLQQKNEISDLKLERKSIYLIGLLLLLLLVVLMSLLIIRQIQFRRHGELKRLEQQALQLQMNPHFISNALVAIQSFIFTGEKNKAGKYLADFSELMRLMLKSSRSDFITLESEVRLLTYFLELQQLRFSNKFSWKIEVEPQEITDKILIPPMLTQPFVENAVEHGFALLKTNGFIQVRFYMEQQVLLFEVTDNGMGREEAARISEQKSGGSVSTSITRDRLNIMAKRLNTSANLQITDLFSDDKKPVGTKVTIELPYKK